jgi:hypothetical protein
MRLFMLSLAFVGCGTGSSPSDPFIGSWSCSGTDTITWTMPAGMSPTNGTPSSTVVITDDGNGNITAVRTPTGTNAGAPACTTKHLLGSGGTASLSPVDQTCMTKDGATETYHTISWTASGSSYAVTSSFHLAGGKNAAGMALVGDGTSQSTCTKM